MSELQTKEKFFLFTLYATLAFFLTLPIYDVHSLKDLNHITHGDTEIEEDLQHMRYNIAWIAHSLLTDPFNIFNTNIFYPNKNTLFLGDSYFTIGLLALPAYFITKNPIFASNFVWYFLLILGAYTTFLLAYNYTQNKYAAFIAGIIFGFYNYRIMSSYLIHMLAIAFIPLIILYYHKLVQHPSYKNLSTLILLSFLTILSSWYTAAFLFITLLILGLPLIFHDRHHFKPRTVYLVALYGTALIIITLPLVFTYDLYYQKIINKPEPNDVLNSGVALSSYFFKDTNSRGVFMGYTLVILFFLTLIFLKKFAQKNKYLYAYLFFTLFCIFLSLGPFIRLTKDTASLNTSPLFYYALLGPLTVIRDLPRYSLLAMFAFSITAAITLARIMPTKKRLAILFTLFLTLLILAEHKPNESYAPLIKTDIPEVYQWLKAQPGYFAIFELPELSLKYTFYSTYHWKHLVNGFNTAVPNDYLKLMYILNTFPSEESLYTLQRLNVTYILVHTNFYAPPFSFNYTNLEKINNKIINDPRIESVIRFNTTNVYKIRTNATIKPFLFPYITKNWNSRKFLNQDNRETVIGTAPTITIISYANLTMTIPFVVWAPSDKTNISIYANTQYIASYEVQKNGTFIQLKNISLNSGENELLVYSQEKCKIPYFTTGESSFNCDELIVGEPTFSSV